MKTLIEVEIFGQSFTVTSEDEEGYVRKIASYVDQRMRQIGETAKTNVPLRVAIMAALSIADEYYKASQREVEIQREAERLSALLLDRLEQSEKKDGVSTLAGAVSVLTASPTTNLEGETKKEILPPS